MPVRLLSLEYSRPLQINDDDCDVEVPMSVEEARQYELEPSSQSRLPVAPSPLALNVEILRTAGEAIKARRLSTASQDPLSSADAHFEMCAAALPLPFEPETVTNPRSASPVITLQNTRLVLHRQNLSPANAPEVRRMALDQCTTVARDTASFLSRLTATPSPAAGNVDYALDPRQLVSVATTMFCTHLWRCTLFLCLRRYYREAQICARVSAAVGDFRAINPACGRNLAFFLQMLVDFQQINQGENPEADEEILAYVSGDLQADPRNAWVWHTSAAPHQDASGMHGSREAQRTQATDPARPRSSPRGSRHDSPALVSSITGRPMTPSRLEGPAIWEYVLQLLDGLVQESAPAHTHESSPTPSVARQATSTPQQRQQTPSFNRISIANII